MSAVPKHRSEFEEYLEIEGRSPIKPEFTRGELIAIGRQSRAHNVIGGNFYFRSRLALDGRFCEVSNSAQMVYVKYADLAAYPDL